MTEIFFFIDKGLDKYSQLCIPDFNTVILDTCKNLNYSLNFEIKESDYAIHLENQSAIIRRNIQKLFNSLAGTLYVNLEDVFYLLETYQNGRRINKKKYRDHYYHSIQCFLLALSIYPVLINIFDISDSRYQNITTMIFEICIYHDLGYLYNTDDSNRINETIKNWIVEVPLSEENPNSERMNRIFNFVLDKQRLSQFTKNDELKSIWESPYNRIDDLLLKEVFNIGKSGDAESHHSYESAVLLYRFVRSFDLIKEKDNSLPDGTIDVGEKEKKEFVEVIKAILLHDFNMKTKISFEDYFWACLLMLVDEIQSYGRPYQDESFNINVLVPSKVGIEILGNGRLKLSFDEDYINTLDKDIQKSYQKYSSKKIYDVLVGKICEADLTCLFEM